MALDSVIKKLVGEFVKRHLPTALKAVLFDLINTLIYFKEEKRRKVDQKCIDLIKSKYPELKADLDELLTSIRRKYSFERSTGAMSEEECWELVLKECGIVDKELVGELVAAQVEEAFLYEDAVPAIKVLKKNEFKIGVLANSRKDNEAHARQLLDKHIDAIVYSHKLGFRKPHRTPYLELCRLLGVKPVECVFVSDEIYEDLWGAKRLGMQTAFIKRDKRTGHFLLDPGLRVIEPDFEGETLSEIAEKIVEYLN